MNKEKILIVGAGGLGRVVLEHIIDKFDCYFIDDGIEPGKLICGKCVVGKTSELKRLFGEFKKIVVAIGENHIRKKIFDQAIELGYVIPNVIGNNVYISPFSNIGIGNIFLENVVIQNGSSVGNGVILNSGVEIHHDASVENFVCIYTNSVVRTKASIEDFAKLGSNVTISNNMIVNFDSVIDDGVTIR